MGQYKPVRGTCAHCGRQGLVLVRGLCRGTCYRDRELRAKAYRLPCLRLTPELVDAISGYRAMQVRWLDILRLLQLTNTTSRNLAIAWRWRTRNCLLAPRRRYTYNSSTRRNTSADKEGSGAGVTA